MPPRHTPGSDSWGGQRARSGIQAVPDAFSWTPFAGRRLATGVMQEEPFYQLP